MTATIQTVTLSSSNGFGRKVPPKPFGELLRVLPDAIRYSIRMAIESRSRAGGKCPRWLAAAADVRFLDHTGDGDTVLRFEAPQLGEAARTLYRQKSFWPTMPEQTDTGFDLLGDVVADVVAKNSDIARFDRALLKQMMRFKAGLNGSFQSLSFTGHRYSAAHPAMITPEVIETASRLSNDTPVPQQARVFGRLDMIRSSTGAFAIKLNGGCDVKGTLVYGRVSQIKDLLDRDVLVLGKAVYRPSGKLLRIEVLDVIPGAQADKFFSQIPKPKRSRFNVRDEIRAQQHKKGIEAIFGKWPGDETDEEVVAALREIG